MAFKLEYFSLVGLILLISGWATVSAATVVNNQVNVSATSGGHGSSQATVRINTVLDGEVVTDINERVVATTSATIMVATSTQVVLPREASTTRVVGTQAVTIIKWWQEWFNYVRFIFQFSN